ncbi:uncharacterized protein G2W53_042165 [Senna tora]|uniref:Uncharacterized protein n=1 Tax=Senna tora TaxID=362788 RepID=A0A834STD0_9FABA|nr:uncharacterized protein G2W53_042165 [Senna tora]
MGEFGGSDDTSRGIQNKAPAVQMHRLHEDLKSHNLFGKPY